MNLLETIFRDNFSEYIVDFAIKMFIQIFVHYFSKFNKERVFDAYAWSFASQI